MSLDCTTQDGHVHYTTREPSTNQRLWRHRMLHSVLYKGDPIAWPITCSTENWLWLRLIVASHAHRDQITHLPLSTHAPVSGHTCTIKILCPRMCCYTYRTGSLNKLRVIHNLFLQFYNLHYPSRPDRKGMWYNDMWWYDDLSPHLLFSPRRYARNAPIVIIFVRLNTSATQPPSIGAPLRILSPNDDIHRPIIGYGECPLSTKQSHKRPLRSTGAYHVVGP